MIATQHISDAVPSAAQQDRDKEPAKPRDHFVPSASSSTEEEALVLIARHSAFPYHPVDTANYIPARRSLHRRQLGFRVKYPSRLMGMTIPCESMLEAAAAEYFEFNPRIRAYFAQPSKEEFIDESGKPFVHYPDFLVQTWYEADYMVAVKPWAQLFDPAISNRLGLIREQMASQGRRFVVLTDKELDLEPRKSNLALLRLHVGPRSDGPELEAMARVLAKAQLTRLADVATLVGGIANAYRLVARRYLIVDLFRPLQPSSLAKLMWREV